MTPKEFQQIEKAQREIIEAAEAIIWQAYQKATKCGPPKNRRPAVPEDIIKGAIIWHKRSDENVSADWWGWSIVEEPLRGGKAFKAYANQPELSKETIRKLDLFLQTFGEFSLERAYIEKE